MRVKKVYQDDEGNWHIDYGYSHLVGLAIRVWLGGLFLWINLIMLLIIFSGLSIILAYFIVLFTSVKNNYFPKEKNNSSFLNIQSESIEKNKQPSLDNILTTNTSR